ncbi:DUF5687 family protein [Hyunsoonleella sp. 2307UL5-6]|uniref:DUF5687 family protein n=1 Tax=Hyunsoonleella sp. 2307UL5-6 TaxID=3384768 RepID=UPI0039BCB0C1
MEVLKLRRASHFKEGIISKIFLVLLAISLAMILFGLSFRLYHVIEKLSPQLSPINTVNRLLIYWFFLDLLLRYFVQKSPTVNNVLALMVFPIKRSVIIHYFLVKSLLSIFNFLPLLIFTPFSLVLFIKGYDFLNVFCWFLSIIFIVLFMSYVNSLIKKSKLALLVVVFILFITIILKYFSLININELSVCIFNTLFIFPYLFIVPISLTLFLYYLNFKLIRNQFYLDRFDSKIIRSINTTFFFLSDFFEKTSPFLRNDIKLIWRNSKPKHYILISFVCLFYGLIVFKSEMIKINFPVMLVFISIFVSGGFLLAFAQLVPSWDSSYYKLLMCQNILYKDYLKSKWYLMVIGTTIFLILSIPYIYFGWNVFQIILTCALFNIGVNSFLTLLIGAFNRKHIELNKSIGIFETNEFNSIQIIFGLLKFIIPTFLFYIPYKFINFNTGLVFLVVLSFLGIILREYILDKIVKVYRKQKYRALAAFSEK